MYIKNIKQEIEVFAGKNNLTLMKFIDKLGMSKQGFYDMFSNDSMKVSTLMKIAKMMDVPVSYFFDESKKEVTEYEIDRVFNELKTLIKEREK